MSRPQNARVKHLVACLSSAMALAPVEGLCISRIVNNCGDTGPGSLRAQVAASSSDDVVDLSTAQLSCSLITLTSGEISVPQKNLTVKGPSNRAVTIRNDLALAGPSNRVFHHTYAGTGTLTIEYLTLYNGKSWSYSGSVYGGCIASTGNVSLFYSSVSGCSTYTHDGASSLGGAIYASGGVYLYASSVVGSYADDISHRAWGGGIYARSFVNAVFATISGNSAQRGGGIFLDLGGTFAIANSTIDSNSAQIAGGIYHTGSGLTCSITSSTISGNVASQQFGALHGDMHKLVIANSTIAFNAAPSYGGIWSIGTNLYAYSSIIARNSSTSPGGFSDVFLSGGVASFQGSANLVQSYNVTPAAGTVTVHADPQLAPLAHHGGPTRTHALLSSSPAIDAGANPKPETWDQRGNTFAREVPTGKPDIGAYERQINDDEIFYGGFE